MSPVTSHSRLKGIKIAWTVLGVICAVYWVLFVFIGFGFNSTGVEMAVPSLCMYFLPEIILFVMFSLLWLFLSPGRPRANNAFIIILSVLSAWHLLETFVYCMWMSADGFNALALVPGSIFIIFLAWVILLAVINNGFRKSMTGAGMQQHSPQKSGSFR
ncbi:MAG: hypothetical protein LUE27_08055 [Clostridia bacterium]|nr:hypothetical protein [Clostridia bacterium]